MNIEFFIKGCEIEKVKSGLWSVVEPRSGAVLAQCDSENAASAVVFMLDEIADSGEMFANVASGEKVPLEGESDWTCKEGISNSSDLFETISERIVQILFGSAHDLIRGRARSVAQLILAQLAHVWGLGPDAYDASDLCDLIRHARDVRDAPVGGPAFALRAEWDRLTDDDRWFRFFQRCIERSLQRDEIRKNAEEQRT